MSTSVTTYKLRGGQITPIISSCDGTGVPTQFIMQTFGVEKTVIDIDSAKATLLSSSDMQGQKPGDVEDEAYRDSTYSSASYSGRPLRTTDGELVFTSSETHVSEFVEEEEIGIV